METEVWEAMVLLVSISKMTLCYDGPQNLVETMGRFFFLKLLKRQALLDPKSFLQFLARISLIFKCVFLLEFEFKGKKYVKACPGTQLWYQTA